jgi:hypothetical protein
VEWILLELGETPFELLNEEQEENMSAEDIVVEK